MTDPMADPIAFRRLMGRWPTGVAVVTTRAEGRDHGLTVNALLSVSLHPPTLLVSLGNDADSTPVVERSGRFAASFLSAAQRAISERFAQTAPSAEKFRNLTVDRTPAGLAVLPGIGRPRRVPRPRGGSPARPPSRARGGGVGRPRDRLRAAPVPSEWLCRGRRPGPPSTASPTIVRSPRDAARHA